MSDRPADKPEHEPLLRDLGVVGVRCEVVPRQPQRQTVGHGTNGSRLVPTGHYPSARSVTARRRRVVGALLQNEKTDRRVESHRAHEGSSHFRRDALQLESREPRHEGRDHSLSKPDSTVHEREVLEGPLNVTYGMRP